MLKINKNNILLYYIILDIYIYIYIYIYISVRVCVCVCVCVCVYTSLGVGVACGFLKTLRYDWLTLEDVHVRKYIFQLLLLTKI